LIALAFGGLAVLAIAGGHALGSALAARPAVAVPAVAMLVAIAVALVWLAGSNTSDRPPLPRAWLRRGARGHR
jgi:hypothetical protein